MPPTAQLHPRRRRRPSGDAGVTLTEVLVAMFIIALGISVMVGVIERVGRYSSITVASNQARQINQDVLGYLVAAPTNVIEAVAPVDADTWTPAPASLHVDKASLPGYATSVKVLSATAAHLQGQNIEVLVQTCYTPPKSVTAECITGSVVRGNADLSITPPPGLARATVACDGKYTADNDCTPLLAATRQTSGTVLLTVTGPQPGKHGQAAYTMQRARNAGFTDTVTDLDTTSIAASGTTSDQPPADPAHDVDYYYRVQYSYPGYQPVWSLASKITVPAAHPACTADPAMTAATECTPVLTIGATTPNQDPAKLDIPLLVIGPADEVTYTIQKLRVAAASTPPTDADFTTSATKTVVTATGPRPALPADTEPYSADPANPDQWYYRISYGTNDQGKTIWSAPASLVMPGR